MTQMVHTHTHFKAIVGPGRVGILGFVYGGIANEMVQRSSGLKCLKIGNKVSDALQVSKFELHDNIRTIGHAFFFSDCWVNRKIKMQTN